MQSLELVGYTADLTCLVLSLPATGQRLRVPISSQLLATLVEVLELTDDDISKDLLVGLAGDAKATAALADGDRPSAAAALIALGRIATGQPKPKMDGSQSRLTPSEIQRMLRAGKSPETVAEQAGVSHEWVMRWYQPIAAEQRKVATSVRGSRQERQGFGLSDDLIGDAVRINLLARDVDADDSAVQWSSARPEGRPYWTVTLRFKEGDRVRRATWRYDIGTGKVTPRDDLALDLGWTMPVTHPSPGRLHLGHADDEQAPGPIPRAAPPPPPSRAPVRWAPPTPPASPRKR
ncbi:MAG: septation protein SepH [Euzebya sp.]